MNSDRLIKKFDKQAHYYERRQRKGSFDERWRKQLFADISGEILEIAVGAGANFKFYPRESRVTAFDFSEQMLRKAKKAAEEHSIAADFVVKDLDKWEGENHRYDFVVSTLSLCGYDDPVKVIRSMARSCKPNGKLLFMEHGLCRYRPARTIQRWIDPINLKYAGCHINRDIEKIVRSSGVNIERLERKFFGIIYMIWARP